MNLSINDISAKNLFINLDDARHHEENFIKELQQCLKTIGYYNGLVNGIVSSDGDASNSQTLRALALFKKARYLDNPYIIDQSTAKNLLKLMENKDVNKNNDLIWYPPTKGIGWISSPFGFRSHQYHNGVDIVASVGTPVVAAKSGSVVFTVESCRIGDYFCSGGKGNLVRIHHSDGYQSFYSHLLNVLVSEGQEVKGGDKIGEVGTTGYSGGPHLHFGTSYQKQWVDPQTLFRVV